MDICGKIVSKVISKIVSKIIVKSIKKLRFILFKSLCARIFARIPGFF